MIAHLIACTAAAAMALVLASFLRARSASLRYSILLASLAAFAVPTPLLTRAAQKLMACFVVQPPSFSGISFPLLPGGVSLARAAAAARPSWHASPELWLSFWSLGSAVLLALWLRRLLRSVPVLREARAAEVEALACACRSLGLDQVPDLCITAADRVPGARGWIRPSVVLPDGLSDRLTAAELHSILTHEIAHIARRDNLSAGIARIIVSVFWFHPLLWWIERRMLAERETACDEMVLAHGADPADYVSAILQVCRMSFEGSEAYAGATGANLKQRMEQIMSAHTVRPASRFLRAIPGLILALGVAGSYVRAQVPSLPEINHAKDALFQKAKDCLDQGRFQEAENRFRQLYIDYPSDMRGVAGLVETLFAEKRQGDAIQFVQSEIRKNPGAYDLRTILSNLYVRTEQYDQAIAELQDLLSSPRSAREAGDLHFRLGETYRRKGDLESAMREFNASTDADPSNPQPLLQLALLSDAQGQRTQASALYEKLLQLQPDHPVALNNLAYLRSEAGKDLDQSLAMALQAHQKEPDSAEISDTVGWIYTKMNRPGDAEAALRDALQKEPNNASFHYHLGVTLLQGGDQQSALEEFQAALDNGLNKTDAAQLQTLRSKIGR